MGDTFPVGCSLDKAYTYSRFHEHNPDFSRFDKYGIYSENCGFDSLYMSYGHDEYLARTLEKYSRLTLPREAIYVIRFHSFYTWHANYSYEHLASEYDWKMLPLVKMFQKCDLYSKDNETGGLDMLKLEPIYKELVEKFFPEPIEW